MGSIIDLVQHTKFKLNMVDHTPIYSKLKRNRDKIHPFNKMLRLKDIFPFCKFRDASNDIFSLY